MQNKAKVSIIIPVYNVEKYIYDCVDRVLTQTLQDIEIILVDDGSCDNSGKICDDYAKKDKRVKVIHQVNGKQGKARNEGVKIATGEYIGFVDGDDCISSYMYEELYNKAKATDADIVMCDYYRFLGPGRVSSKKSRIDKIFLKKDVFNMNSLPYTLNRRNFFCIAVCWNKLFKRDFYLKNLKFPENIIFEDSPVMFDAFVKAEKISVVNKKLYYYRVNRQDSSSVSKDGKVLDLFKSGNLTLDNLLCFDYNKFRKFVIASIVRDYIHHLKDLTGSLRIQYVQQLDEIIKRIKEMGLYKFVSFKDKIRLFFIFRKGFKCQNII